MVEIVRGEQGAVAAWMGQMSESSGKSRNEPRRKGRRAVEYFLQPGFFSRENELVGAW